MIGAELTIIKIKHPVNSMEEVLNSDYNVAIRAGGTMESIFLNSAPQSDEYQVNEKGKIENEYEELQLLGYCFTYLC